MVLNWTGNNGYTTQTIIIWTYGINSDSIGPTVVFGIYGR